MTEAPVRQPAASVLARIRAYAGAVALVAISTLAEAEAALFLLGRLLPIGLRRAVVSGRAKGR